MTIEFTNEHGNGVSITPYDNDQTVLLASVLGPECVVISKKEWDLLVWTISQYFQMEENG